MLHLDAKAVAPLQYCDIPDFLSYYYCTKYSNKCEAALAKVMRPAQWPGAYPPVHQFNILTVIFMQKLS
jgi:hypothetical protein